MIICWFESIFKHKIKSRIHSKDRIFWIKVACSGVFLALQATRFWSNWDCRSSLWANCRCSKWFLLKTIKQLLDPFVVNVYCFRSIVEFAIWSLILIFFRWKVLLESFDCTKKCHVFDCVCKTETKQINDKMHKMNRKKAVMYASMCFPLWLFQLKKQYSYFAQYCMFVVITSATLEHLLCYFCYMHLNVKENT